MIMKRLRTTDVYKQWLVQHLFKMAWPQTLTHTLWKVLFRRIIGKLFWFLWELIKLAMTCHSQDVSVRNAVLWGSLLVFQLSSLFRTVWTPGTVNLGPCLIFCTETTTCFSLQGKLFIGKNLAQYYYYYYLFQVIYWGCQEFFQVAGLDKLVDELSCVCFLIGVGRWWVLCGTWMLFFFSLSLSRKHPFACSEFQLDVINTTSDCETKLNFRVRMIWMPCHL